MNHFFKAWQKDLPASIVVFFVALPLCIGLGLASTSVSGIPGLPSPFAGILAGIIGGIIVGAISGSSKGVSGPAAGLITIVIGGITVLGSYQGFLLAVVLAGIIQLIAGFLRFGLIANYFPSAVIKGMLASIGIILILKQMPHLIGFDADFIGDEAFIQKDGHNTLTELFYAIQNSNVGAFIIGFVSLLLLIIFDLSVIKKIRLFSIIPGLLLVVVFAIILNQLFLSFSPSIAIKASHLVKLPVLTMPSDFFNYFIHPDLSFLKNVDCYVIAFTLAIVGSLETLLGAEATDKLDNERMITPTNRELKAQGIGNILSGLVGGLPITQVIVRSSANIGGGAKSKLSTILHGFWLLLAVLFGAKWLNLIPLSVLAALLVFVGYKLTKINLFREQFKNGLDQFIPFCSTILGVLFTDLLIGIAIGIAVSMFFLLRKNFKNDYRKELNDGLIVLVFSEDVSFLNKASIKAELNDIPSNYALKIDGTACKHIDFDVLELMREFMLHKAPQKNISVELINIKI